MRATLLIAVIFLLRVVASAQTQQEEKARLDTILQPDTARTNSMQSKKFYSGKNAAQSREAQVKSFYYTEKVTPKTASTKDFPGTKSFAGGNATVPVKQAETHRWHWLSNLGHAFGSKKADTKEAWDAEKKYPSRVAPDAHEYGGPEQKAVAETFRNHDKKMSMNDVRELLNKNK